MRANTVVHVTVYFPACLAHDNIQNPDFCHFPPCPLFTFPLSMFHSLRLCMSIPSSERNDGWEDCLCLVPSDRNPITLKDKGALARTFLPEHTHCSITYAPTCVAEGQCESPLSPVYS